MCGARLKLPANRPRQSDEFDHGTCLPLVAATPPRERQRLLFQRRADAARQRGRERAVGAFAVERDLSGAVRMRSACLPMRRPAPVWRARPAPSRLRCCGPDLLRRPSAPSDGCRHRGSGRWCGLIVRPAMIYPCPSSFRSCHCRPETGYRSLQVIATVDLHAVTGVVDHRRWSARHRAGSRGSSSASPCGRGRSLRSRWIRCRAVSPSRAHRWSDWAAP